LDEGRFLTDMCIMVFKALDCEDKVLGCLVANSERTCRSYVGCSTVLTKGEYLVIPASLKLWSPGM